MPFGIINEHNKEDLVIGDKIRVLQDEIEKLRRERDDLKDADHKRLEDEIKLILPPGYTLIHTDYWNSFNGTRLYILCYHKDHCVKLSIQEAPNGVPDYLMECKTELINPSSKEIEMPESVVKLVQNFKKFIQEDLENSPKTRLFAISKEVFRIHHSLDTKYLHGLYLDMYLSLQSGLSIKEVAERCHLTEPAVKTWIKTN